MNEARDGEKQNPPIEEPTQQSLSINDSSLQEMTEPTQATHDKPRQGIAVNSIPLPRNGSRYRIFSYQRVSVLEAQTGSHTFETQTLRIRQKCDEIFGKDNYDLVVKKDDGQSGASGFRPTARIKKSRKSLMEIKTELLGGTYDAFIVYDLSRFCRSPHIFYEMLEDIIYPSNVLFLSATENFDFNTAIGRAMGGFMSVVNGMLRDVVVARCKDAAATRAEAGFFVGQPGYGWVLTETGTDNARGGRGLMPVAEEVPIVRLIADQYLAGWSICRITRHLNEAAVPSPSGKAKWTNAVVYNVMDNPVHAGHIPWKGELIQGEHWERKIYGDDLFTQIQEARKRRSIMRTRTATTQANFLLPLAKCARCGRRLYISGAHDRYAAYRCTTGMNQGQRSCPNVVAAAHVLEGAVVSTLQQSAQKPELQALLQGEAAQLVAQEDTGLRAEGKRLQELLSDQERQFGQWAEMSLTGLMTQEQFACFNRKLLADQASAREKLAAVEAALTGQAHRAETLKRVQKILRDFPLMWHHLGLDERREVLGLLIQELRVDRDGNTIHVYLKASLLPEQELLLEAPTGRGPRRKPAGIAALTPRQLAVLYHVSEGRSLKEASVALGITYTTVKSFSWQVQKTLGMSSLADAAALARPRINALLGTLPVGQSQDARSQDIRSLKLSDKLMEVLPHMAKGATNVQIAQMTGLPKSTVGARRKAILQALGATTVYEAVRKAEAAGLI